MAALYALGIDNCLIQVNGPEFPILDGSAPYYVNEIARVGTVEQNAVKDFYIIKSKIEFRDETTGSSIIVLPDENFSLNVLEMCIRDRYGRWRWSRFPFLTPRMCHLCAINRFDTPSRLSLIHICIG